MTELPILNTAINSLLLYINKIGQINGIITS